MEQSQGSIIASKDDTPSAEHEPWRRLVQMALDELRYEERSARRAYLLWEAGEILWGLGDRAEALRFLARARDEDSSFVLNLRSLRHAYLELGRHDDYLKAFDEEIRRLVDPAWKAALICLQARALERHHGQFVEARRRLESAESLEALGPLPLLLMQDLGASSGDWNLVVKAKESLLPWLELPHQRSRELLEIGLLRSEILKDREGSIQALRQAVEEDPANLLALMRLEGNLRESGRLKDLAITLEAESQAHEDPREAAACLLEAEEIWRTLLGDHEKADKLLGAAAKLHPGDQAVLAVQLLARAGLDDLTALAEVYRSWILHRPTGPLAPLWLTELGVVLECAGDLDGAVEAYQQALSLEGADQRPRIALELLAAHQGQQPLGPSATDPESLVRTALALLRRRKPAEALKTLIASPALTQDPWLMWFVGRQALASLPEAAVVLEGALQGLDSTAQTALRLLDDLWHAFPRDAARALPYLEEAYDRSPQELSLMLYRMEVAREAEAWDILAAASEQGAQALQGRYGALLLSQAAETRLRFLGDSAGAVEDLRGLLAWDPQDSLAREDIYRLLLSLPQPADLDEEIGHHLSLLHDDPMAKAFLLWLQMVVREHGEKDLTRGRDTAMTLAMLPGLEAVAHRPLERMMERLGQGRDCGAVRAQQAERATSDLDRAVFWLDAAVILEGEDQLEALEAYTRALEACPTLALAGEGMARCGTHLGQWSAVVTGLMGAAQYGDPARRPLLMARVSRVAADRLRDFDLARQAVEEALVSGMEQVDVIRTAYKVAGQIEAHDLCARALVMLARLGDGRKSLWCWLEAARLYAEHLGDPESARHCLGEALTLDPTQLLISRYYEMVARAEGDPLNLIQAMRYRAKACKEAGRLAYLCRIAALQLELGRYDEATSTLDQVRETNPNFLPGQIALEELEEASASSLTDLLNSSVLLDPHQTSGPEARMVRINQRIKQETDTFTKAALIYDLACRTEAQGEERRAMELYQQALEVEPDFEPVYPSLAVLLRRHERFTALHQVLRQEAGCCSSGEARSWILREIAHVHEMIQMNPSAARQTYFEALNSGGDSLILLQDLERAVTPTRDWKVLEEAMTNILRLENGADRRSSLLMELARLRELRLRDRDGALNALTEGASINDQGLLVRYELMRHQWARGQWRNLATTLSELVQLLLSRPEARTLAILLAQVLRKRLRRPEEAVDALTSALRDSVEPRAGLEAGVALDGRGESLLALRESARAQEDMEAWSAWCDTRAQESLMLESPALVNALTLDIAAVQLFHLQSPTKAFDTLEALDLPQNLQASLAIPVMGLLAEDPMAVGRLIKSMERILEVSTIDPSPRTDLLLRKGWIQMRTSDAAAFGTLSQALASSPDLPMARRRMMQFLLAERKSADLLDLLDEEAEISGEEGVVPAVHRAILMELWDGDRAQALREWTALDELGPEALRNRARLEEALGLWSDLVETVNRQREGAGEPEELAWLGILRAEALDHLDRPGEAAEALAEAALELGQQGQALILTWQEELLVRAGRWKEVARLLAPRATKQIPLGLRLAHLLEVRLGMVDEALQVIRQVHAADPNGAAGRRALLHLAMRAGAHEDLVRTLAAEGASIAPDPDAGLCAYLVALVAERRLGRPDFALDGYRRAAHQCPELRSAFRAITRLLSTRGDWNGLVEHICSMAASTEHDRHKGLLWHTLADVHDLRRTDPEKAADSLGRAYLADGSVDHLYSLMEICRRRRQWSTMVSIEQSLRELASDDPILTLTPLHIATLQEDLLGKAEEAMVSFLAEVQRDGHPYALEGADALARLFKDAAGQRTVDQRLLERCEEPRTRSGLLVRLGRNHESINQRPEALAAYKLASETGQGSLIATSRLYDMLANGEDWAGLAEALREEASRCRSPLRAGELLFQSGRIREESLEDLKGAEGDYRQALVKDPSLMGPYERLAALLEAQGDLAGWVEIASRRMEAMPRGPERLSLMLTIANRLYYDLAMPEEALGRYKEALREGSDSVEAKLGMLQILLSLNRAREAALMYEALVKVPDLAELTRLHSLMGVAYDEQLRDLDKGIKALRRAITCSPDDLESRRRLVSLLIRQKCWAEAAVASGELVSLETDRAKLAEALEQNAVALEKGGDMVQAAAAYRRLMDMIPTHIKALKELWRILGQVGEGVEAVERVNRSITRQETALRNDPFDLEALRALAELLDLRGDTGRARSLRPLIAALAHEAGPAMVLPNRPLSREEWSLVIDPGGGELRNLFRMVDPYLTEVYPSDLDRYGVGPGERFGPGGDHPARKLADEIGRTMRAPAFDLFVSPRKRNILALESTGTPCLIIGADVLDHLTVEEARFRLGRLIARIVDRQVRLSALSQPGFEALYAALVRVLAPERTPSDLPTSAIEGLCRRIRRTLPHDVAREARAKAMDVLGEGDKASLNIDLMKRVMEQTANQAGLVICTSPAVALSVVAGGPSVDQWRQSPDARALARYLLSEPYLALHGRLR